MLKKILFISIFFHSTILYAGQTLIVDDNWLKKNLNSSDIRLIDMSDETQYQRFHIPGAIHLPYSAINYSTKDRVSYSIGKGNMIKILGMLGVTNKNHIVIYDDMGGLNASRLFWELDKLGHKNVSLLNGGLVKWILSGKKVVAAVNKVNPVQYIPLAKDARDNLNNINTIMKPDFSDILLDVRSEDEYKGDIRYPRSGHIPGAKSWEWQQAVDFDNGFTFKDNTLLKNQLQQLGISKLNAPLTVYCQSGHRASHSYFILRNLGFTNVKLYDGSMSEYSQLKSAPLTKGITP